MSPNPPLLETIMRLAREENIPCVSGTWANAPAPHTYLVLTPLADDLTMHADNIPGVEVEYVRVSLFTTNNYLPMRDRLTRAFHNAGVCIEARTYIGHEADTGYHHYAFDLTYHRIIN